MTFPVEQCKEWQCRYVFPDKTCCGLPIHHSGDHKVACGHGWHFDGPCNATYVEHVHCSTCGKRVSGVDPEMGLVVRAYVECPECLERGEWQPIETAPKDGTRVLLFMAEHARVGRGFACGDFDRPSQTWLTFPGRYQTTKATHWIKLPEPPR